MTEWAPSVDIIEDDKEWLVKADLPEVKKEDVKVTVENGPTGWAKLEDFREKAPVVWQSNRHEIMYQDCLGTKDRLEALAAFAEKRTPVFRGE